MAEVTPLRLSDEVIWIREDGPRLGPTCVMREERSRAWASVSMSVIDDEEAMEETESAPHSISLRLLLLVTSQTR
ncbi:hypothetical protein D9619_013614 [Psilocybe cf. subviscida]|uniref:Uncharacterized protein n=1 Tax=Psilocybe cf. subviscida TaxID=2480587 RepID=A0A8H5F8Y4_9AGAR|nr:hypothetical protein D9619_013614 [Psilocybe cf. subviscida]